MGKPLSPFERAVVQKRNDAQAAENAAGKQRHQQKVDGFYDRMAEQMEPIVHAQLRAEGRGRKYF